MRLLFYDRLCIVLLISILASCKKDAPIQYPPGSNENINQWVLDSLRRYYYWSDKLPVLANLNQVPKDFFQSVMNPADRFSYILLPNDLSTWPANSKSRYGFDYGTLQTPGGLVMGVVKLVFRDSPASRAGLRRGDYFIKINGQRITRENAQILQHEMLSSEQVTLAMATYNNNQLTETQSIEVTAGPTWEQYAFDKIIESRQSKVGYLYFSDFNTGLAASLYNVFAGFKTAGVSELILDLRYNSGGQVSESAALCTMIAPGVSFNTPFITYKGNKNGGTNTESLGDAATFDGTVDFNTLMQNNLDLGRIYILGTGATASAAEIMINNLKPFMQVVLIGETTRGKDQASFRIYDMRNPKVVQWEMHPIIYKLLNAQGKGDYSNGISPSISVDELSELPLVSFGQEEDPLLKTAIAIINGEVTVPTFKAPQLRNKNLLLSDTRIDRANESIVIAHR